MNLRMIKLCMIFGLVLTTNSDIVPFNEPVEPVVEEPNPEEAYSLLALEPANEPAMMALASPPPVYLIGLNFNTLKFEKFNVSSGSILEMGSASQAITYLTLYSTDLYIAVDYSGNVFEYNVVNGVMVETATGNTVSMKNARHTSNDLKNYYTDISIYEGMLFNGYEDTVNVDGVKYGVNSAGLDQDHTIISSWGENISGLSVIPEPTVATLLILTGIGFITLKRLLT